MIKTLSIKDFIIIDELNLEFDKGFNVITGETGAGKSIMINAIDLAFGARASKELIKTGKNRAIIELVLELDHTFPSEFYETFGIEPLDSELVISREITETGSRSRVNGVLVTQEVIKNLREMLIDIHNQHMTYTYIQPKHHISLLDNYGSQQHLSLLNNYREMYKQYVDVSKKLDEALNKSDMSEQQIEFLKFQINEIESAQINDIEEDKKLDEELGVLSNVEKLKELSYSSYWALYGDDSCILTALGKVKSNISKASEMDVSLAEYESDLINTLESLRELSSNLRNYSEALELDEQRLDEIQQRIDILDKIKRKYGNTLEQVLETYDSMLKDFNSIEFSQDEIENLSRQKSEIYGALLACAETLSQSRKEIASGLSSLIQKELEKLDMPKVQFDINIEKTEINTNGFDCVEFLISTNISEAPKPLAKIASGGEISRVMLAIKTIFANTDNINTIIFDEIDTGISGNACQAVASEISELAKSHQIISITHQPIIAAKSDRHFYVAKTQDETTSVKVYTLDENNKIKAIAMLAAGEVTVDSVKFAKQLIYG
ncbi:MAG: DNA repair protein RecN [Clostridium sp.]|nr:DNA repair protein RecN [Clostridium sp.]